MVVKNADQDLLREWNEKDKNVLYVSLVPYKNNTCIKIYDEEGRPIGDIPQEDVPKYLDKKSEVLFINEGIDDETGLPVYSLKTIV